MPEKPSRCNRPRRDSNDNNATKPISNDNNATKPVTNDNNATKPISNENAVNPISKFIRDSDKGFSLQFRPATQTGSQAFLC